MQFSENFLSISKIFLEISLVKLYRAHRLSIRAISFFLQKSLCENHLNCQAVNFSI